MDWQEKEGMGILESFSHMKKPERGRLFSYRLVFGKEPPSRPFSFLSRYPVVADCCRHGSEELPRSRPLDMILKLTASALISVSNQ